MGEFDDVSIPGLPGNRYTRYNATDRGKARRAPYNDKRRQTSIDNYLSRQFVAWDGEGINESDGSHTYILLANSLGQRLVSRDGLATIDVFEMMLNAPKRGVTHVIYGGTYDVNMILKDLDRETLEKLYTTGKAFWKGYLMEWRGGKSFAVRQRERTFLLYDVLP